MNQSASTARRTAGSTATAGCCPMSVHPQFFTFAGSHQHAAPNSQMPGRQAHQPIGPTAQQILAGQQCLLNAAASQIVGIANVELQQLSSQHQTSNTNSANNQAPTTAPLNQNASAAAAAILQQQQAHNPTQPRQDYINSSLSAHSLPLQHLLSSHPSNCMALAAAALASASFQQHQQQQQQQHHHHHQQQQQQQHQHQSQQQQQPPPLQQQQQQQQQHLHHQNQHHLQHQQPTSTPINPLQGQAPPPVPNSTLSNQTAAPNAPSGVPTANPAVSSANQQTAPLANQVPTTILNFNNYTSAPFLNIPAPAPAPTQAPQAVPPPPPPLTAHLNLINNFQLPQQQTTQNAAQVPIQPIPQPSQQQLAFFPPMEQALALLASSPIFSQMFSSIYFQNSLRNESFHTHHHHQQHHYHHLHGPHHHHHHHGPNGQNNGQDDTMLTMSESKPRGLNRAEIDSLTPYIQMNEKDSRTCVICLSKFELKSKIRPLPCNHAFHAKCVDKWLRANRTCPICRRDALKIYGAKIKRI